MRYPITVAALAALALFAHRSACADPNDYVASPIVEEGERELELKTGTSRLRDGSRTTKTSLAFGYGINSWWATEVYASWHREPGERTSFDAWEWENRFQLTETGRHPIDLGLLVEIERPRDRTEGYELRWGPLMQAEWGTHWLANLNLLLGKHVRAAQAAPAELSYQWQIRHRWQPAVEFGLQGMGELGDWRHWAPASQQAHLAGPSVFGKWHLSPQQSLKYDLGLLAGLNHASAHRTLRARLELEF